MKITGKRLLKFKFGKNFEDFKEFAPKNRKSKSHKRYNKRLRSFLKTSNELA